MNNHHKVFIVDDDKFLLDIYRKKFEHLDVDVDLAWDSEEALAKLRNGSDADIILLDIVMPGMDGLELLATMRKEKLSPNASVIMLTNESDQGQIEKAKKLGIKGYIIKAVNTPSDIIDQVAEIANLNKK
jgi:CheY-like chemotaxis protein